MGFAENFIAAYHVGASQRRQKDQQALQQQEFEERKKEREQQLTLSQKMFDLHMADAKNAFAKEIIANRASTPTPVQELPQGQAGPPSPVQEAPVMMTDPSSGQQTQASSPHMEELEAHKLDLFEKEKRLTDMLSKVRFGSDIPELGIKKDVEYDPKDVDARKELYKIRTDPMRAVAAAMLGTGGGGAGVGAGAQTPVDPNAPPAQSAVLPPALRTYVDRGAFTGAPFLNATRIPKGKIGDFVNAGAAKHGIQVVGKDDAEFIHNSGAVADNLDAAVDSIKQYLPKDATGRIISAPTNTLAKILQTDEARGAFNVFRDNAFQIVKAMGGSSRMPLPEFQVAMQNIPTLTDTFPVAQGKVNRLKVMFENKERRILGVGGAAKKVGPTPEEEAAAFLGGNQ